MPKHEDAEECAVYEDRGQIERGTAVDIEELDSIAIRQLQRPHILARTTLYPLSDVRRFLLPDEFVSWAVRFTLCAISTGSIFATCLLISH